MDAFRTACVYVRNIFAGKLCETDAGYSFSYDEQYVRSENAYVSKTLFSFFDGLIPEGWLLDVVSRMKSIFEQIGGTYTIRGEYRLTNLSLPAEEKRPIGEWGQR